MKILTLFAGFLFLAMAAAPVHQFHVSKTTLRYVAEREQVQVEMHVFLDDLEKALLEAGAPKLFIGTKNEQEQAPDYLARYLDKHFSIEWNGENLPVDLLGYELSEDLQALWIYGQASAAESLLSIRVRNAIMTEIYEDQKNMVRIEAGDKRTTLLMTYDQPERSYGFE